MVGRGHREGRGRQRDPRPGGGLGLNRPIPGRRTLALAALLGATTALASGPGSRPEGPEKGDAAQAHRVDVPGELLEARLNVTVDATGTRAELRYRLRPAAGAERIPLRALDLPDARPLAVTAAAWEDPVPVSLARGSGGLLEGDVLLPTPTRAGDVVILRLRYRVGTAPPGPAGTSPSTPPSTSSSTPGESSVPPVPVRVRVPVLAVPWPPAEALPGTFEAWAVLPEGTLLGDGFPAAWVREEAPDAGASRWRATLPVLPSLVGFRVMDRARPTLPGVLTACALVLLGALLAGGVLHLRRS